MKIIPFLFWDYLNTTKLETMKYKAIKVKDLKVGEEYQAYKGDPTTLRFVRLDESGDPRFDRVRGKDYSPCEDGTIGFTRFLSPEFYQLEEE